MDSNLLKILLHRVEEVVIGGGDVAKASPDNYMAWCSPGIPFQAEDLQFAVKGINGKDADETVSLIRNATEFAHFANSIPSSNVIGGTFEQKGSILWDVYERVLKFSKVKKEIITDEEIAKIERIRGKLVVKKEVVDIITDEKKEVSVCSPIVAAYNAKMVDYLNAVSEYNSKRLSAVNGESKAAVQDFSLNADGLRRKVKQAMDAWVTEGYKEDVEKLNAYIRQASQRSMVSLKANLQDRLEQSILTDPTTGGKFYFTSLYPSNFINTDKGWTQLSFNSNTKDDSLEESHSSTSANAGLNLGLWKADAKAKHTQDKIDKSLETSDFEMKFKITQATLGRGWFDADFLTNGLWNWDTDYGMLSDGEVPPQGNLIAYPTTAVFIKDIEIKSSALKDLHKDIQSTLDAGGSVGWGPIKFAANHHQDSKDIKNNFDDKTNTLRIEGMQLIAFKCFALPKTPNCIAADLE